MLKLKSTLIEFLIFFVPTFGLTCLVPFVESKSGDKFPLGAIYVNNLDGWLAFKIGHILLCLVLAGVMLAAYRRFKSVRSK